MKTLVKHTADNGNTYAIVKTANGGYKVLVRKHTYRDGWKWYTQNPKPRMTNNEFQEYATNGTTREEAIKLFERKAKVELEVVKK